MLALGWWGLIGLAMTPVYFVRNLYHLSRIVSGPKAAPRQRQAAVLDEGVWPPPPAAA